MTPNSWGHACLLASVSRRSGAIERLVAADRHPMAVTAVWVIVEHRVMLGAAVVPERHRVRLPLEAALEFRRLDVAVEHFQQRIALVAAELGDAQGEATVDVEPLLSGHRMGADDRMLGIGKLDVVAVGRLDAIVVRLGAVVQGGEAREHLLDRLGERLVGAIHVGEQRIAAAIGRHLGEIED